jgi:hypothetical protein
MFVGDTVGAVAETAVAFAVVTVGSVVGSTVGVGVVFVGDTVATTVGATVGINVGATVLTTTIWTNAVDPSTFSSSSTLRFVLKPVSILEMFMSVSTITLVTTVTLAAGLSVMAIDNDDASVLLTTEENAIANAVVSADDAMTEAAVLTSVVVMTAEIEAASRRVKLEPATETAEKATLFALAIAALASSRLVSSGKAYDA